MYVQPHNLLMHCCVSICSLDKKARVEIPLKSESETETHEPYD